MTYAEFVAFVRTILTTDANRKGAIEFADELILQAICDLQQHVPRYKKGHTDTYVPADFESNGFVSVTDRPANCETIRDMYVIRRMTGEVSSVDITNDVLTVTDHGLESTSFENEVITGVVTSTGSVPGGIESGRSYYIRPVDPDTITLHETASDAVDDLNAVDITDVGSGTITLAYRESILPTELHDWDDRYSLKTGTLCINDRAPRVALEPHGSEFWVYPLVQEEDVDGFTYAFEVNWDGIKIDWVDADDVPFDRMDAQVVADYVSARMERKTKRDLAMAQSFSSTHQTGRMNSRIRGLAKDRSQS